MNKEPTGRKHKKGVLPPRREGWRWKTISLAGVADVRLGTLVAVVLGFCLAVVLALWMVFLLYRGQEATQLDSDTVAEVTAKPTVPVEPFGPGSEDRLSRIIEKHVGSVGLKNVQSLVLSGRYTVEGRTYDTDFILRRPNRIRHVVKQEGFQTVRVFDGTKLDLGVFDAEGKALEIPAEMFWFNAYSLLAEGSFGLLAWSHLDRMDGFRLEARSSGRVRDVECLQIISVSPLGTIMEHMLDPLTGHELARRVRFSESETAEVRTIEVEMDDFAVIDGVEIPMRYAMRLNGETQVEFELETVRKDVGVLPSIFRLGE